jgi:hypothetical protein
MRIITSYFQGLTDHSPIQADYDPRCDRYHSGNRVTHNPRNGIEQGADDGCYESNLGPKPWGPATEVRIGLVDPECGIVIGYAILYYGNSGSVKSSLRTALLLGFVHFASLILHPPRCRVSVTDLLSARRGSRRRSAHG